MECVSYLKYSQPLSYYSDFKKIPKNSKKLNISKTVNLTKKVHRRKKMQNLILHQTCLWNFLYLQSYNFYHRRRFSKNPTLNRYYAKTYMSWTSTFLGIILYTFTNIFVKKFFSKDLVGRLSQLLIPICLVNFWRIPRTAKRGTKFL